jgi:predicted Zn-dependent peptidase
MKLTSLEHTTLENGLKLYCGYAAVSSSFEIAIHVDSGSRDETFENNGISHFLEHMMFRGSQNFPNSILLASALESFGGETNAMTGVESTVFWLRGSNKRLENALATFAEFIINPTFPDLETERSIILQELQNDYNEDDTLIDSESLGMEAFFDNHPLGYPIIGRKEVIEKLDLESLKSRKESVIHPLNCALSVTSDMPLSQLKPLAERFFGKWKPSAVVAKNRVPWAASASNGTLLKMQNNSDSQYSLKIMFPSSGGMNENVVHDTFLQRILDDGIASRLPSEIREKCGLVYDISADNSSFSEIGAFSIATISKDDIDKLIPKLFSELERICEAPPSAEEMDRIKFRYGFDLDTLTENHSRYVSREVWNHFLKQELSIEQEAKIVQEMTPEMVLHTARRIFGSAHRAVVLVGPKARKKRDLVEKSLQGLSKFFVLSKGA